MSQSTQQRQLAEMLRNKGFLCHNYLVGVCKQTNCPYMHVADGEERPVPDSVCLFFRQSVCLREKCKFFHGAKADLDALRAAGSKTFRPQDVMKIAIPPPELSGVQQQAVEASLPPQMSPLLHPGSNSASLTQFPLASQSPSAVKAALPPLSAGFVVASQQQQQQATPHIMSAWSMDQSNNSYNCSSPQPAFQQFATMSMSSMNANPQTQTYFQPMQVGTQFVPSPQPGTAIVVGSAPNMSTPQMPQYFMMPQNNGHQQVPQLYYATTAIPPANHQLQHSHQQMPVVFL